MTREDVIRLAREAGGGLESEYANISALERFAALVAAHEREQCAKVCDPAPDLPNEAYLSHNVKAAMRRCAAAIRKRGTE